MDDFIHGRFVLWRQEFCMSCYVVVEVETNSRDFGSGRGGVARLRQVIALAFDFDQRAHTCLSAVLAVIDACHD
jgi:hypothetical protein